MSFLVRFRIEASSANAFRRRIEYVRGKHCNVSRPLTSTSSALPLPVVHADGKLGAQLRIPRVTRCHVRRIRFRSRREGRNARPGWGRLLVSIDASKNSSSSSIVWREEEMLDRLGSGTACSASGAASGAAAGIDGGGGGGSGDAIVFGGGSPFFRLLALNSFSKSSPSLTTTFRFSSQTCSLLCSSPK